MQTEFNLYEFTNNNYSTGANLIPIALKFVLVEFILVKNVLVGDPLYQFVKKFQFLGKQLFSQSELQKPALTCLIFKQRGFGSVFGCLSAIFFRATSSKSDDFGYCQVGHGVSNSRIQNMLEGNCCIL